MNQKSYILHSGKLICISIMIIIIFFTLSLFSYYSFSSTLKGSIQRTIIYRTAENADFVKKQIEAFKESIEDIALRSEIRSMHWIQQKPILLTECERFGVGQFVVADLNGKALTTNGDMLNISDSDYYKKAKNGISSFTDPFQWDIGRNTVLVCAVPIYNDNVQVTGVLAAILDPQFLHSIIESRRVGMTGYGFIVNKQGMVVIQPQNEPLLLPQSIFEASPKNNPRYSELAPLIRRMAYGEIGSGFYEYNGIHHYMAFAPISGTNWSLALTVPRNEIFYEVDALKNRFLVLAAIALSAIIFFSILLYKYTSQRDKIESLQRDADKNAKLLMESIELDKLKTDFFANISHEMRTPLNVILATLQLLNMHIRNQKMPDAGTLSRHLGRIQQNCLRSIRLANNLIDTTKIDAGFFEVHLKNHDIIHIVEEITLSVADYIKDNGISLQFDTEIEEKVIACDAEKIERIMLNLLSNALKFTNRGGNIFVNIYDRGSCIAISVRDTGVGIPENMLDLIFKRFRQVDKLMTRNHEGSGIGLSLVKSLVEMHDGNITVSSVLGEGSEFIIELPVQTVPETGDMESLLYEPSRNHAEKINIEFSDIYSR